MKDLARATMLAAAALGVVLSATACAAGTTPSGGGSSPAASSPDSPSTSSTGGAGTSGTSGTSGSGGSGNSGGSGGAGNSSGTGGSGTKSSGTGGSGSECLTRDLRVTDETGPKPGPGLRHTEYLVFQNVGAAACTIQGYPGVSFVAGDAGTQVGSAFVRTSANRPSTRLAPGSRAYASITITQAPNACSPVQARGYRVYPPDETHSIFVSKPQLACTDRGQSVGAVAPITAGRTR